MGRRDSFLTRRCRVFSRQEENLLAMDQLVWVKDRQHFRPARIVGKQKEAWLVADDEGLRNNYVVDSASLMFREAGVAYSNATELTYLNPPNLLDVIRRRFLKAQCGEDEGAIYTNVGWVLVCVNPWKAVDLYTDEWVRKYVGRPRTAVPPHAFAVADYAYHRMISEGLSQSIVITGESGSGKTETSKHVLKYLSAVSDRRHGDKKEGIEHRVLQSNPLLEAFGNASTVRNRNSSRFGKLMLLHFQPQGRMISSSIETFLLAKSRVVDVPEDEKNYHIFYSLCSGLPDHLKKEWGLMNAGDFPSLRRHETEPMFSLESINEAFASLQFDDELVIRIYRTLAAVLHLCAVKFDSDRKGYSVIRDPDHIVKAAQLLGLAQENRTAFVDVFLKRQVHTEICPLQPHQSRARRDSTVKSIYDLTFKGMVQYINSESLAFEEPDGDSLTIGVLDVFGFENLEPHSHNSFEQLCINFTNELLQQYFLNSLLWKERALYVEEKIAVPEISLDDAPPVHEAFMAKGGLFQTLDDWTFHHVMPGHGDKDVRFCSTVHADVAPKTNHRVVLKDRMNKNTVFTVSHFAGDVKYTAAGFVGRNGDLYMPAEVRQIVESGCDNDSLLGNSLLVLEDQTFGSRENRASSKQTNSRVFLTQLSELIRILQSTSPHFIRCIKPNDSQSATDVDLPRITQQLISGGLIDVLLFMKKGYPCQLQIRDLYEKYHKLLPTDLACRMTPRDFCAAMVDYLNLPAEDVAYGISRIFFRFAVLEQLSKVASLSPEDSEVMVANMVDYLKRRKRLRAFAVLKCVVLLDISFRKRRAAVVIARSLKAYAKRRVFQRLRKAAVTIQRHVRGRAQRIRLRRASVAATIIQAHARGYMTRVSYVGLRRLSRSFTCVKRLWRGRKIRRLYIRRRDGVRYLVAFLEAYAERLRLEALRSQAETQRRDDEARRLSETRRLDDARELEEERRRRSEARRASEARRFNEARELEEKERRRASEARRLNEARELEEKERSARKASESRTEFDSMKADEAIESILAEGLEIERRMTAETRQMRESMLNILASPDDLDQQIACHAEANTRFRVDASRRQSYAHIRLQQSRRQELGLLTFRQLLKCRAAEFIARQCQLHLNRRPLVETFRTPARRRRMSDPFQEPSPIVKQLSSVKRRHGDDSLVMAEWTPQRAVKENKLKQLEEQIENLSQRNETLCAEKASIQADFNKLQHIKNAVQTEIEQLEKRLEHTRKSELTALEAEAARKREEVAEIGQRTRELEVRAEKKQAELVRMEHRRKSVGTELRELEAKRLEIDQVIRNLEARREVEQGLRPSCVSVGRSSGLEVNIHSFNSPGPFQRTSIFGDLTGVRLSNANNTHAEADSPILVFTESAHQSPISAAAHYRRTDLSAKLPLEAESQENVWMPSTTGSLYKRFGEAPRPQKTFVNAPVSRGRALSVRRDAPANPPRRRSISRSVTSHPRQNSISRRDSRERLRSSSRCRIGEDYPGKRGDRTPIGHIGGDRAPPRFQTPVPLPRAPSLASTPSKIRTQPKDARFKSRIRAPSVTRRT